ncbi:aspartate-semialdehyde dehydrogenase [Dacryopinax primogenitus]|uniref:Aspartate-semialdehyde dehydrogenase n=1 Tax=Dacryopinax primogenitus (strain DJM 731) TaxID=1858805 RepID=M5GCA3_DACPD|nr:aspartate-semialdehyde dehydrogenase [Dacryopinax primogenitus]EJU06664.1 aspartate-semialdehyde dehydrogenase [Dacryopinax primogenitus]
MAPQRQLKVGILGATGTVGQRFIKLLALHPYMHTHVLGASARSAGQKYIEVVKWKQVTRVPEDIAQMVVEECVVNDKWKECDLIFSGLAEGDAGEIESAFCAAELPVFSNAKNHRRDPLTPLIVPLVNTSHLSVLPAQQAARSLQRGFIVTNANCSTTGIVIPLKALEEAFGPLDAVIVTTMQAISGAGYPGVSSFDIMDNVVPYIGSEEEKIEWETSKILGGVLADASGFDLHAQSPLRISASCNRVPVLEGHTECVSVSFKRRPAPSPEEVKDAMRRYTCEAQTLNCPSAPKQAIVVHEEVDRPQPRLDRDDQEGAGVNVGRVRRCGVLDIKFVVLSNNVGIGAATSSITNAEVAHAKGIV